LAGTLSPLLLDAWSIDPFYEELPRNCLAFSPKYSAIEENVKRPTGDRTSAVFYRRYYVLEFPKYSPRTVTAITSTTITTDTTDPTKNSKYIYDMAFVFIICHRWPTYFFTLYK
jgi:hypothetical protein